MTDRQTQDFFLSLAVQMILLAAINYYYYMGRQKMDFFLNIRNNTTPHFSDVGSEVLLRKKEKKNFFLSLLLPHYLNYR